MRSDLVEFHVIFLRIWNVLLYCVFFVLYIFFLCCVCVVCMLLKKLKTKTEKIFCGKVLGYDEGIKL